MAGEHGCPAGATLPKSLRRPSGEEGAGQDGFTEERMLESGICREDRHPQNKGNEGWDRLSAGWRWQRMWGPKDGDVSERGIER